MENKKESPESVYTDKKPRFVNKESNKFKQTWNTVKIYFFVIAISIILYFALLRLTSLSGVLLKVIKILSPILYGIVFAYLLNPMMKVIENILLKISKDQLKKVKKKEKAQNLIRGASIFISLIIAALLIYGLCNMVLPELYRSIRNLIISMPGEINLLLDKLNTIELKDTTTNLMLKNLVTQATEAFEQWLVSDLLKQTNIVMSGLTEGVIVAINTVLNVMIGVIISIYLLFSKETFIAQSKKALYAFTKPLTANKILLITKKSNEIFGGFIIGKIIDSAIIGVICFAVTSLFNFPYAMLVSVIIGVTNIIPFFGPFIGAVPSAFLIILQDPKMGLYFILFIIVLQQIDGNIIGPKILGNSTGLPAFWVIFSILLGGGLFGFAGMLIGVPTFSVIYYIVQMIVNQKLENKDLPTQSEYYDTDSYVTLGGEFMAREEEKK
ncbi:AI-2E family transporter [Aequitasia blattaphilus]|nr:AI-2E family transporter [Aequitasia blattaphilus]